MDRPVQLQPNPLYMVFDQVHQSTLSINTRNSMSRIIKNENSFSKVPPLSRNEKKAAYIQECKQTEIDLPTIQTACQKNITDLKQKPSRYQFKLSTTDLGQIRDFPDTIASARGLPVKRSIQKSPRLSIASKMTGSMNKFDPQTFRSDFNSELLPVYESNGILLNHPSRLSQLSDLQLCKQRMKQNFKSERQMLIDSKNKRSLIQFQKKFVEAVKQDLAEARMVKEDQSSNHTNGTQPFRDSDLRDIISIQETHNENNHELTEQTRVAVLLSPRGTSPRDIKLQDQINAI